MDSVLFSVATGLHVGLEQLGLRRQFEVLDVAWDATLGSASLDLLLLEHFAKEFEEQHPGLDPRKVPRVSYLLPSAELWPPEGGHIEVPIRCAKPAEWVVAEQQPN